MFINISLGEQESVKILKEMLDIANADRKQLLDALLNLAKPEVVQAPPTIVTPILPKTVPWRQRQQALEQEDRHQAKLRADAEKLEKELGVVQDATGSTTE